MSLDIHSVLQKVFGFSSFRGEQEKIILSALQGESSLVLMPTGMGKSLCYQLPAVTREGLVLVISPLIALMQDQVLKAKKCGIRAAAINSAMSKFARLEALELAKANRLQLLYVTPERFKKSEFLEVVKNIKIQLLAVDEAHCISQWGHDFRPDYSRLGEFRELLGNPPTVALTATATPKVQQSILQELNILDAKVFSGGLERPNLELHMHEVYGIEEKIRNIVALRHQYVGSSIIYFSLISSLQKTSHELAKLGLRHLAYHGDLDSQERHRNQKIFQDEDNQLMLATPAFGLGIDKADIRLLIHCELPNSVESYYQEVGRAGRDGLPAFCHLFFDNDDVSIQMEFIKWANPDPGFIKKVYHLIADNSLKIEQDGMNFLREQMNFYNKRDYRVETAVNQLERWGSLKEAKNKFGFEPVEEPALEFLDDEKVRLRIKTQNEKLLEMVRLASMTQGCRMQFVLEYFGHQTTVCGKCDLCSQRSH